MPGLARTGSNPLKTFTESASYSFSAIELTFEVYIPSLIELRLFLLINQDF